MRVFGKVLRWAKVIATAFLAVATAHVIGKVSACLGIYVTCKRAAALPALGAIKTALNAAIRLQYESVHFFDVRMCFDVQMCRCANLQMCRCADVWMCGCADVQMCGCVLMCRCADEELDMPLTSNNQLTNL